MLKTSLIQKYKAILDAIEGFPGGAGVDLIEKNMPFSIPRRTLQRHLGKLVEEGRLEKKGQGRAIRYLFTKEKFQETQSAPPLTKNTHAAFLIPLSDEATLIENHINQPLQKRIPVGYNQEFLDSYRPGVSFYLPESLRAELLNHGQAVNANKPAGTYARRIATRLLIDLSWNSSRLEGNTYSLTAIPSREDLWDRHLTHPLQNGVFYPPKVGTHGVTGNCWETTSRPWTG